MFVPFLWTRLRVEYVFVSTYFDKHIKNSYDIRDFIIACTCEENEEMHPFDGVSLFTYTPVSLNMIIIGKKWEKIGQHNRRIYRAHNLTIEEFIEPITSCTNNIYFAYTDQCYRQCYGTPISPTPVELLMDCILDLIQEQLESKSLRIRVIRKYVDDLFFLIPIGLLGEVLLIFNSINERIQFTFESERDDQIPFLDMTVHRDEKGRCYRTYWYK